MSLFETCVADTQTRTHKSAIIHHVLWNTKANFGKCSTAFINPSYLWDVFSIRFNTCFPLLPAPSPTINNLSFYIIRNFVSWSWAALSRGEETDYLRHAKSIAIVFHLDLSTYSLYIALETVWMWWLVDEFVSARVRACALLLSLCTSE